MCNISRLFLYTNIIVDLKNSAKLIYTKKNLRYKIENLVLSFHFKVQLLAVYNHFNVDSYSTISYILIASKCGHKAQCQFYSTHISACSILSFHG